MTRRASKLWVAFVMGCLIAVPVGFLWKVLAEERQYRRELEAFWDEGARSAAIVEGERMIAELDAFFARTGAYPADLEGILAVSGSASQPLKGYGVWEYRVDASAKKFWLRLCVGAGCYPSVSFSSDERRWNLDS